MIQADGLSKEFAGRWAVQDLTFAVEPGEIFGFLGPNGAGKTTTIRMLTGQIRPTRGQAVVAGHDVTADPGTLWSRIGVVFDEPNVYERLSGRMNLEFFGRLYGAGRSQVDAALEAVGLTARAKDPVRTYSRGMKQRLMIARALLPSPQVLFLDEPTVGLDPHAARDIRSMVQALGESGVTIFLTTHYMEEASELCRRVAIVDEGRIVALDTPGALRDRLAGDTLEVTGLSAGGGDPWTVSLPKHPDEAVAFLSDLVRTGRLVSVQSTRVTLEDVFIALTGKRLDSPRGDRTGAVNERAS